MEQRKRRNPTAQELRDLWAGKITQEELNQRLYGEPAPARTTTTQAIPVQMPTTWYQSLWRGLPINPYYWMTPKEKQQALTRKWAQTYGLKEPAPETPVTIGPRTEETTRLPYPETPAPELGTAGERFVGEWAALGALPGGLFREPFALAGKVLPKALASSAVGRGTAKALDILLGKTAQPSPAHVGEEIVQAIPKATKKAVPKVTAKVTPEVTRVTPEVTEKAVPKVVGEAAEKVAVKKAAKAVPAA